MSEAGASEVAASDEVLVEVRDGVAVLTLHRPRAINALTAGMTAALQDALDEWRDDDRVRRIELRGAGDRGFCAGADVKVLREWVLHEPERALRFFEHEYRLNADLAHYPKPITAFAAGITMGGGMGVSMHVPARVGSATSRLAMPEVTIGLFPDVGMLFPLSRMPGETGTWMALTGESIDASSALWAGLLTRVTDEVEVAPEQSWLATARGWIDECFAGANAEAIVDRLRVHESPQARAAATVIEGRSPLSVAVTLEALRRAAAMDSLDEVLAQDLVLARSFVADSDFVEGVRAQVVDKDRSPNWTHASLADVSSDEVLARFA